MEVAEDGRFPVARGILGIRSHQGLGGLRAEPNQQARDGGRAASVWAEDEEGFPVHGAKSPVNGIESEPKEGKTRTRRRRMSFGRLAM